MTKAPTTIRIRTLLAANLAWALLMTPALAEEPATSTEATSTETTTAESSTPVTVVARGRVEGVVLERGTKRVLTDVNVYLLPHKLKATSDAQGRFVFEEVPVGGYQVVVSLANYKKYESNGEFNPAAEQKPLRILLERSNYQVFEITVRDKADKRDDTTRSLRQEQFLFVPGAAGDPVKAVQNLPGVSRAQGFSSQVIIQGAAPQDTAYLLDNQEVPLIFHFGGFTSVITPEAVDQVDYLSAGYGPEYGRAIGGLIGIRTRNPTSERLKGFAFLDSTKAGGLIEGPVGEKSSFLLTGRYSYIGEVLRAIAKGQAGFDLAVAPNFGDFTGIYKTKFSDQDEFKILGIYSQDELAFVLKEPVREDPGIRGSFQNNTDFYRIIPQWERRLGSKEFFRSSFGIGKDMIQVDAGENFFDLDSFVITHRSEWESKLDPSWTSYLGVDAQYGDATVNLRLPSTPDAGGVNNPFSSGETFEIGVNQKAISVGPYWRNTINTEGSPWTLMPSLRVDYFSQTKELLPQPRLATRYQVDSSLFYRAAAGLYFQPPEPQETSVGFGNPDVNSPYSIHYTMGFEKDFRDGSTDGFNLQTNLFYRQFDRLVIDSQNRVLRNGVLESERFNNDGEGRSYGIETFLKYGSGPVSGWLVYTLSRSFRSQPGVGEFPFQFDQTHNVNLVGSYDAGNNWRFSTRLRYVTGNPITPVSGGVFDANNDVYFPVRGPFFSERLNSFFQLDFRIDKTWVYDSWTLNFYFDIQNVTNRENIEGIRYSYNFAERRNVMGLPLFPIFGFRGDF